MEPRIGAVSASSASVRTRWRPQGCPAQGHPPKNRSEKKSPENSSAPSLRKVIPKDGFRVCRGLLKFLSEAKKGGCSRAPSPPRLAAGAGDRNAETLKDFYVFGL